MALLVNVVSASGGSKREFRLTDMQRLTIMSALLIPVHLY